MGLPPLPDVGTKGHTGQAAHGSVSGRAEGGRSRLPPGSRHKPSAATHPPVLDILRPHRSWTARAGSVGRGKEAVGRGKGGLLGPCGLHACPEVQPRALDPRSWIPWPLSWPWALTAARAVEAGETSALGQKESRKKGKERNPVQHTWGWKGDRQKSPRSKERCVGGHLGKSPRGSSRAGPCPA